MAQPHEDNIDWAWSQGGPPTGNDVGRCKAAVINGTTRGDRSAHDCVVECIQAWVQRQDFQTAIAWLVQGSHCHDAGAQADFNAHAGAAVTYAVQKYGPQIGLAAESLQIDKIGK